MLTPYNFADAQRLLIKPFERLRFIITFTIATCLGRALASFIVSQLAFSSLLELGQMQYAVATGLITGICIGACQWLVLRRYILDWKWILIVGLSTTFTIVIMTTASDTGKDSLLTSGAISSLDIVWSYLLIGIVVIVSSLTSGYLNWFILRPYISNGRWWIFVPLIAALISTISYGVSISLAYSLVKINMGFSPILLARTLAKINTAFLGLAILTMTQAIGFCILKKKHFSDHPILQSPLALTPDITNYWTIQRLQKKLYTSISKPWKTDLAPLIGTLDYLVGINRQGRIIGCEPVNQVSLDHIDQTPLLELADANHTHLQPDDSKDCAKFQVTFMPPATVQIHSWRGIPLVWLGTLAYVGIFVAVIGLSGLSLKMGLFE